MAAIFAFHVGKSVVQIAAIEIVVYHLLDIRPPEALPPYIRVVTSSDAHQGDQAEAHHRHKEGRAEAGIEWS